MTKLRAVILWFGCFCSLHKCFILNAACWLLRCVEVLPCAHDFVSSIYAWQWMWMLFLRNHVIYRRLKKTIITFLEHIFTVLPFSINNCTIFIFSPFSSSFRDSIEHFNAKLRKPIPTNYPWVRRHHNTNRMGLNSIRHFIQINNTNCYNYHIELSMEDVCMCRTQLQRVKKKKWSDEKRAVQLRAVQSMIKWFLCSSVRSSVRVSVDGCTDGESGWIDCRSERFSKKKIGVL